METGKGETPSILFPIRQHGIHTIVVDCAALACRDDVIANRLKIHLDFFFFFVVYLFCIRSRRVIDPVLVGSRRR